MMGVDLDDSLVRPEDAPNVNLRAERELLGAILTEPGALARVAPALVRPEDFYDPRHGLVLGAALEADTRGMEPDVVTVCQVLKDRVPPRLEAAGGPMYVAELPDWASTAARVEQHARLVASLAGVRRGLAAAGRAAQMRNAKATDLVKLADEIAAAVRPRDGGGFKRADDGVQEAFQRLETRLEKPGGLAGLQTGYRGLDAILGGLEAGRVYTIAARPGVGKTAFAVGLARATVTAGTTLFFSLEMPQEELYDRLMCAEAGVDNQRYRAADLTAECMQRLARASEALFRLPLLVADQAPMTFSEIRGAAKRERAKGPLAAVFIDYLQLVKGEGRGDSRENDVGEVSRGLKALAKEMDCPVVALAQLNRKPEGREDPWAEPKLSDLRESGSIEQDSDVVAFLQRPEVDHREDEDLRGRARLVVKKNRGGAPGVVDLVYRHAFGRFVAAAQDNESAPDARVAEEIFG
jgi:replicative DNA helicase